MRKLIALAAAAALAAGCAPGPGPARTAHRVATGVLARYMAAPDGLPADCLPSTQGPPTSPDQLGLIISVSGGSLSAGPVSVNGISAHICGVASVAPGVGVCPGSNTPVPASVNVVIPADGQKFGPVNATINIVPGMQPAVPFVPSAAPITTSLNACGTSINGLQLNATASITGAAGLFGISCAITVTPTITGAVTGPFTALQGTLTASNFTIPAATASPTCPPGVATNLNTIVGLPLTTDSLSLPFTGYIYYLPASP